MKTNLAQTDLLLLVADLLRSPDDSRWRVEVAPAALAALCRGSGLDNAADGSRRLDAVVQAQRVADPQAVAAEYRRLFDGAQACPPNETAYVRRDKGALLADIAGFHRAFGFDLAEDFREKHDHVVVELQFAALLSALLSLALQADEEEHVAVARTALRGFLEDHLGAWIGAFADRLEATAQEPYYAALARLLRSVWTMLADHHGLSANPLPLMPTAAPGEGTPYECGLCPDAGVPPE